MCNVEVWIKTSDLLKNVMTKIYIKKKDHQNMN